NGGRGVSIKAVADRNIDTLSDYRQARLHRGKNGENGRGADQDVAAAPDITPRVPVGTTVFDAETGEQLFDLDRHNEQVTLAAGGHGGLGNLRSEEHTSELQ